MKIKTVSELSGFPIGRRAKSGVHIKCGDRVAVTERTPARIQTTTQDGWGRDVPLCQHDQQTVAEKVETFRGIVKYSERFCAFRVYFSDRWPDEDFVYMFSEIEVVSEYGHTPVHVSDKRDPIRVDAKAAFPELHADADAETPAIAAGVSILD